MVIKTPKYSLVKCIVSTFTLGRGGRFDHFGHIIIVGLLQVYSHTWICLHLAVYYDKRGTENSEVGGGSGEKAGAELLIRKNLSVVGALDPPGTTALPIRYYIMTYIILLL